MDLHVEHTTEYRYTEPNKYSIQYVRLTPVSDGHQQVRNWRIDTLGSLAPWIDGFGNEVHTLVYNGEHDSLTLTVHGLVSTTSGNAVTPYKGTPEQAMFLLQSTALTKPSTKIRELVAKFGKPSDDQIVEHLHKLMANVREGLDYVAGETLVTTTAAEAFDSGKGVCQDHAHIFCVCARLMGIPARYVSGYLGTAAGGDGQDASHAWAEVLVPNLGWVGFDPANCSTPNENYIKIAIGRDYLDAAPIRGTRHGGGEEQLTVRVAVLDSSQEQ